MVPNTSDDLPDPETPVNTVSRRLGISTLTSFRLFSRAPWTRIRSWLSAGCCLEEAMFAIMSRPPYQRFSCVTWIRLPQVSFSMAILEAVTSVGGMVNSAPRAFIRS